MPGDDSTEPTVKKKAKVDAGGEAEEDKLLLLLLTKKKQLAAKQGQEKDELERKQRAEMRDLKTQHQKEKQELESKHCKAWAAMKAEESNRKAGTLDAEAACAECGKTIDTSDEADAERIENFFTCGKCDGEFCNTHKTDMSTCVYCGQDYCEDCLWYYVKHCSGCERADQLACCNLQKMPCGTYECTEGTFGSGPCNYYHHKHCQCETLNDRSTWG